MEFKDIKAGYYSGKATKWGYRKAGTGSESIAIEFDVTVPTGEPAPPPGPDGAAQPAPTKVFKMVKDLYFTEGAWQVSMRALEALGVFPDSATEADRVAAVQALFDGEGQMPNEVDLDIKIENSTYTDQNGETKKRTGPKIEFINRKGGGFGLKLDDYAPADKQAAKNRFAALAAKMSAKAANANTPSPTRPGLRGGANANGTAPTPPTPALNTPDDSDIPF